MIDIVDGIHATLTWPLLVLWWRWVGKEDWAHAVKWAAYEVWLAWRYPKKWR